MAVILFLFIPLLDHRSPETPLVQGLDKRIAHRCESLQRPFAERRLNCRCCEANAAILAISGQFAVLY